MFRSFFVLCFTLIVVAAASADVPTVVPFQARLVDATGAPVGANTAVTFAIFATETGGSAIWGPELHTVTPENGIVSVLLGDGDTPDPFDAGVFARPSCFLEVVVAGETLTPRFRMAATGFAFEAAAVEDGAIDTSAIQDRSVERTKLAVAAVGNLELGNASVSNEKLQNGSVDALKLASNSVTSAKIATDAVTSAKIANNAVNAARVLDEPGISSNRLSNQAVTLTNQTTMIDLITTTITTPSSGRIVVQATGTLRLLGTTSSNYVLTQIDETAGGSGTAGRNMRAGFATPAGTGAIDIPIFQQRIYTKAAGQYTFRWEGMQATTTGTKLVLDPNVVATFYPTAYGTVANREGGHQGDVSAAADQTNVATNSAE